MWPDADARMGGAMRTLPMTAGALDNGILSALPPEEWEALRPDLSSARLVVDQVLVEAGDLSEHVYFIEQGLVCLLASGGGRVAQVGMVGKEGMVCAMTLLCGLHSHDSAVVHVSGLALRIPLGTLRRHMETCAVLRERCLEHIHFLVGEIMEAAAFGTYGTLEQRCARWLLMADVRVDGGAVPVTQEVVAGLLCARRPGVSTAIAQLQGRGLIRAGRGRISVLDRHGLAAVAAGKLRETWATDRA